MTNDKNNEITGNDLEIHQRIVDFDPKTCLANLDYSKIRNLDLLKKEANKLALINASQIPMVSSMKQKLFLPKDNAMREGKYNGINNAISKVKKLIKVANKNLMSQKEAMDKFSMIIQQSKNAYLDFEISDNKVKTIRKFNELQTETSILIYFWGLLESNS